jgi:hypothetical protein
MFVAAASLSEAAATEDPYAIVRGVTVSCPGAGLEWGSDDMVRTLAILEGLGVNWVAIHPYGGIRDDGTVGRSRIDRLWEDPSWLTRAIRAAHAKGIKIMITPHVAYWGSRFEYRAAVSFDDEASWARFFGTYEEFIVRVARLSTEADAFVVGSELDRTTHREREWRRIIAAVRREFRGPMTYAAGWDAYAKVAFWDALDVVAVQGYFPLVQHEGVPTDAELTAAWSRIVADLESFGRARGRRVVLGELGYNRSLSAAVRPWEYPQDAVPEAEVLQTRCLDAALGALSKSRGVAGAFLWKWFPGEVSRGNFLASTPAMRNVIARYWRADKAPR